MRRGLTLLEILIVVAVLSIVLTVILYVFKFELTPDNEDNGVLPGEVKTVCLEGYQYLYVQSRWEHYSRAAMAPKFDINGNLVKCPKEMIR